MEDQIKPEGILLMCWYLQERSFVNIHDSQILKPLLPNNCFIKTNHRHFSHRCAFLKLMNRFVFEYELFIHRLCKIFIS